MDDRKVKLLRSIPSVNELLQAEWIKVLFEQYNDVLVKNAVHDCLDEVRKQIVNGQLSDIDQDKLKQDLLTKLSRISTPSLRPVINGTGVVLHTNLGRSILSPTIKEKMNQIMFAYSNLEYDLNNKQRGLRYHHVEKLIKKLTGAQAALVVNNNAAAVMLVLDSLVKNKEVIVSRGELVEIGGSFRIPEIITKGGGTLREVGTTNKTHLNDYRNAITEATGALLKVHTSNYRIIGFTEKPSAADLFKLTQTTGIPLINDLGSGLLVDLSSAGLPKEPLIQDAIKTSDIVTFSGDKLLGGPQAGIIAGSKQLIDKIKQNQLLRALRVDKMTLAALEETLRIYLDPQAALAEIPTLRMITANLEKLNAQANQLARKLTILKQLSVKVTKGTSQVGGGSFPGYLLPTFLVSVAVKNYSVTKLEAKLREGEVPIIARLEHDNIIFDVRTLQKGDDEKILQKFRRILI